MSEERDTSNMGRPRLVEGQDTKPVTIRIPESLHREVRELARGELPEAVRAFIYAYMATPEAERWRVRDPEILGAAVSAAVNLSKSFDR